MLERVLLVLTLLSLAGISRAQALDESKINNRNVRYVSPAKLRRFPVPVLTYLHDEAEHERLKGKVMEQVVYPLIRLSANPVAAVIVDFCPDIVETISANRRGCEEDRGELVLGITIRRWDGATFLLYIERNQEGSFNLKERLGVLPDSYQQPFKPTTFTKKRRRS
jgi:hypothetical protein